MQKLLFSLIIILSSIIFVEAAPGEIMPQSLGAGGTCVVRQGIDAIYGNPSGLGSENSLFIGSQTYGLSLLGSSFALAKEKGGLGARVLATPESAWGGTDLLLWAGKSFPLGQRLQGGLALSGFFSSAPNISGRGLMLDTGFLWHRGQGKVGLVLRNVAAMESWHSPQGSSRYTPPRQAVLGLGWEGEIMDALVDLWPEGEHWRWQAGMNLRFSDVKISFGYDGMVPSVGIAFDTGMRSIEYSWRGGQIPMGYLGLKFKL